MKLINLLSKEHSRANTDKIVLYIDSNPNKFNELVDAFLKGPYRITQRAAWPLSICVQQHPELMKPHLNKVLQFIAKSDIHDAVKRNTVRLLQFIKIPRSLQGKVVTLCFNFLSNPSEPIAIRVFSMTVLANLTKENPELKNELIPIIEDYLPFSSAGFRSRGMRVLKELKR